MLASAALWLFTRRAGAGRPIASSSSSASMTLVASIYVLSVVPEFLVRFSLWLLTHTIYRIRIVGQENVPSRGPALLVCNHLSHVDGALVGACIQRFVRFLVYKPYLRALGVESAAAADAGHSGRRRPRRRWRRSSWRDRSCSNGHVVCIFAEGAISRTGNMLPFKRGFERIVDGLDVPIVPVYLDRVWGSVFSFKGGRFFWKWPVRVPYPVTVAFGEPLPSTTHRGGSAPRAADARMRLALRRRPAQRVARPPVRRTGEASAGARSAMADATTAKPLTFGRTLVGVAAALALAAPTPARPDLRRPAAAGVGRRRARQHRPVAGRTGAGQPELHRRARRDDGRDRALRHHDHPDVTPSSSTKAEIEPLDGMVFLEDVMKQFTTSAQAPHARDRATSCRRGPSTRCMSRRPTPRSSPRVIFSSGSTGVPKGVMLTHRNILANVDAIAPGLRPHARTT